MKKLLCLVVIAAIALGMATGCEYFDHKTPRRNYFLGEWMEKLFP